MKIKVFESGSSQTMDYDFIGIKKFSYDERYHGLYLGKTGNEEYIRLNEFQAKQVIDNLIYSSK